MTNLKETMPTWDDVKIKSPEHAVEVLNKILWLGAHGDKHPGWSEINDPSVEAILHVIAHQTWYRARQDD